jgi:hypothetical protein
MIYNRYYIVKIIIYNYTKIFKVFDVAAGACGVQVFKLFTCNIKLLSISKNY